VLLDANISEKPSLAMRLIGGREKYRSRNFKSRAAVTTREIEVNHRLDPEGCHRWEMLPAAQNALFGSGWDAATSPRFALKKPKKSKISRSLIFQVRCLREDIRITNIEIISEESKNIKIFEPSNRSKMVAAEAFIKKKLADAGLISGDMSNPFADVCLLETVLDV
jgi:hypothetical protein